MTAGVRCCAHPTIDRVLLIGMMGAGKTTVGNALSDLIGSVPASKLLYGSDQASEPEVFWISARLARRALERVLGEAVQADYLTVEEAERLGRGILAGNTRALHRL